MTSHSLRPAVEILETRIAPATVYFMQGGSIAVLGPDGLNAQDSTVENEAAGDANSDFAVLVKSGDKVVFDADDNHKVSAGDTLLVKITGGQAMLFFTNGVGPTIDAFDKNEITGAAVSNGFSGTFFTDINGSVVTALDANGDLLSAAGMLAVQPSSIKSLTVKGQINGNVLVGGDLTKLHVGNKLFNTGKDYSVRSLIATGTATTDAVSTSFNHGGDLFTVAYIQPIGANGGNISDVKIPFGAKAIAAGDGSDVVDGKAGNGGSVSGVTALQSALPLVISAGKGGDATTSGTGGRGGSIVKCAVIEHTDAISDVSFVSGDGGKSANGNGGAAGAITQLSVQLVDKATSFTVRAGNGGEGGVQGKGGAGGALDRITAKTEDLDGALSIAAGFGGASGSTSGKGGAGGALTHARLTTEDVNGAVNVGSGSGGSSVNARGVDGGKLLDVEVTNLGLAVAGMSINSGSGGMVFGTGNAGNGGAMAKVAVTNKGGLAGLGIGSGSGGDVVEATVPTPLLAHGNGGHSGAVGGIVINNYADMSGFAQVFSGGGGDVSNGQPGDSGNGGSSAGISGVVIHDFLAGGATGSFSVYAGSGKSGVGEGGRGGNVGTVKNITLDGSSSRFQIGIGGAFSSAGFSGSGASSAGGNGGQIKNVHGTAGTLNIVGSDGGGSVDGRGGNGTSVSKVNVTTTGANHFIHLILAGNGGAGADHLAGTGGSVSGVKTTGDIGDFTKTFGVSASNTAQGGIAAGQGGSAPSFGGVNGSVIDIKAARIATIIAGRPDANAVSSLNGVSKLAKIKATVLGADTGIMGDHHENSPNGGTFDWNEGGANNTYEPSTGDLTPDGDTAIDGLILVNAIVAPPLPVTPLKLVLID